MIATHGWSHRVIAGDRHRIASYGGPRGRDAGYPAKYPSRISRRITLPCGRSRRVSHRRGESASAVCGDASGCRSPLLVDMRNVIPADRRCIDKLPRDREEPNCRVSTIERDQRSHAGAPVIARARLAFRSRSCTDVRSERNTHHHRFRQPKSTLLGAAASAAASTSRRSIAPMPMLALRPETDLRDARCVGTQRPSRANDSHPASLRSGANAQAVSSPIHAPRRRSRKPNTPAHPVSLDFQDADLRYVLRAIQEISGLNIVIDPEVKGTVNLVLSEVPWDQALDVILRTNKLGYVVDGTIVRIAPLSVLAAEEDERRKLAEAQADAGDLHVATKRLSYAKVDELQGLLKQSVLSKRGNVQIDPRTNTLIITDLEARLKAVDDLILALDRPQPQVEIEARIVQTNKNFSRSLGIQWGFNGRVDPALGNTTNLAFPNSGSLGGRLAACRGQTAFPPP